MFTTLPTVALLHWLVLVTPGAHVLLVSVVGAPGLRLPATAAAGIRAR